MQIQCKLCEKLSIVTPLAANRVSVTLWSTSGDDQLEFEEKHILFVGDLLQLPPVVSNLSTLVLYPLVTRLCDWPSIRKSQLKKPMRAPNPLWVDFWARFQVETHDIQDWRELQRQFHVTATEKVDVALSFFRSRPSPKKYFSPDRWWICDTNKFVNRVSHDLQECRSQEAQSFGVVFVLT
jgi:hypothetical protein